MLKKHFTILLMLVLMSAGIFAQAIPSGTGRFEAMGNSPFILDAATDINSNPAWNNYYRNYAFGDIGRDVLGPFELSNQYAGVTFGVGKTLNLGLIVNKRSDVFGRFYDDSSFTNIIPKKEVEVPITLLLGYSLNKNFHLSLAPYYASGYFTTTSNAEGTNSGVDYSSSSLGAKLGVLYMLKKGWVEGVINFGMNKFKDVTTTANVSTTEESSGGTDFGVNVRAWLPINKSTKLSVVPFASFETYSWNGTGPGITGPNHNYMNLGAGVGLNLPIMDDIQLAGGLSMNMFSNKVDSTGFEAKSTSTVLPGFHFGGEWMVADWFTARAGFFKGINRVKITGNQTIGGVSQTGETTFSAPTNSEQTVSLGAGFHTGRFSLDASVSEKWLKQGINFVSGTQTDLFGVLSASYNFNK